MGTNLDAGGGRCVAVRVDQFNRMAASNSTRISSSGAAELPFGATPCSCYMGALKRIEIHGKAGKPISLRKVRRSFHPRRLSGGQGVALQI
jgi:hypothetical protein